MSVIQFAKDILKVNLTYYQKELLVLLNNNDRGYIHTVVGRKPTQEIKTVLEVYQRYCENRELVSA